MNVGRVNEMVQQNQRGARIARRIMPAKIRSFETIGKPQCANNIAERMRCKRGINRARQQEGIDPWAKPMEGEDAKKSFLGGGAMGNDPASTEGGFHGGPEIH